KLIDRNAERLAADVEAGIHDGGDGVGRESARGRPRAGVKRGVNAGDGAGVLADEHGAEAVDHGGHALAAALVELGPARDAPIGGDLKERISVPPAVGVEVLELDDLHSVPRGRADLSASPAGLTRGSIFLEELKVHSRKGMDCRVKPGNDADSA